MSSFTATDENAEILGVSVISPNDLPNETKGPPNIEAVKKLMLQTVRLECYVLSLLGFAQSIFRENGNCLCTERFPEDDFKLILKHYNF